MNKEVDTKAAVAPIHIYVLKSTWYKGIAAFIDIAKEKKAINPKPHFFSEGITDIAQALIRKKIPIKTVETVAIEASIINRKSVVGQGAVII